MIESLIVDNFNRDFNLVFGSNKRSHFKLDGDREPPKHVPQWQINCSNARSIGQKTFEHTTPCRSCGGFIRLTHKCYPGTKINKCAGCD